MMRKTVFLLTIIILSTVVSSCGSHAYKSCKKVFSERERMIENAHTLAELSQAEIISYDSFLLSQNEQDRMRTKYDELRLMFNNKFNQFAAGTYSFSTNDDSYKFVLLPGKDNAKIGGKAILYKNGLQVGEEGEWVRGVECYTVMCTSRDVVYVCAGNGLDDHVLLNVADNKLQSLFGKGLGLDNFNWLPVSKE